MPRTRQNWVTAACSSCSLSLMEQGRVLLPEGRFSLPESGIQVSVHGVKEPAQFRPAFPVVTFGLVGGVAELRGYFLADVAVDLERLAEQGLRADGVGCEAAQVHAHAGQSVLAVCLGTVEDPAELPLGVIPLLVGRPGVIRLRSPRRLFGECPLRRAFGSVKERGFGRVREYFDGRESGRFKGAPGIKLPTDVGNFR